MISITAQLKTNRNQETDYTIFVYNCNAQAASQIVKMLLAPLYIRGAL